MLRTLSLNLFIGLAAASAQEEVWQAAVPMNINVNYDVPATGAASSGLLPGALLAQKRGLKHGQQHLGFLAKAKRTMRSDESLPVVNLKLVPPEAALPTVNAEVGLLEHNRQAREEALQQTLTEVYEAALADASARISAVVSTGVPSLVASKHLQQKCKGLSQDASLLQDDFAVRVSVRQARSPDSSVQTSIDNIEDKRSAIEENLFQQACQEMSVLTSFVLQELARDLAAKKPSYTALLQHKVQDLPSQANIRLQSATDAFPRVADLIEAMEARRDAAESEERKHILEMELNLMAAENDMIKEALRR